MSLYDYTSTNSELVKSLELQRHIEGGYFAETHRYVEEITSPLANGETRPIATTIYYLLTADEPKGYFHRNRSHTMHLLHQGRSKYTLIYPPTESGVTPKIATKTMGADIFNGETRQLFVEGGVWKMSGIPDEDLSFAGDDQTKKEKVGCLISEVVAPGFVWQDHEWMTMKDLENLFKNTPGGEATLAKFSKHIRPADL